MKINSGVEFVESANSLTSPDTVITVGGTNSRQPGDVWLPYEMPRAEYMYGCLATACGMLVGYYDRYCYTVDGKNYDFSNLVPGAVDVDSRGNNDGVIEDMKDSSVLANFIASPAHIEHFFGVLPQHELFFTYVDGELDKGLPTMDYDCLADWLATSQYWRYCPDQDSLVQEGTLSDFNNSSKTILVDDNFTSINVPLKYYEMLCGISNFVENQGYKLNATSTLTTQSFDWELYKKEIDAGRPVMLGMVNSEFGHEVLGYGYNNETKEIIFDDTFDHDCRMKYDGIYQYGINLFHLADLSVVEFDVSGMTSSNMIVAQQFTGRQSDDKGGGLVLTGSPDAPTTTLVKGGCQFVNNSAGNGGGGLFISDFATATIENGDFKSNVSANGGALYNSGTLNLETTNFSSNSVSQNGGAIFNTTYLVAHNVVFSGNTATVNGGGIANTANSDKNVRIDNSTFTLNSANCGGAIHNAAGAYIIIENSVFKENLGVKGSALYNEGVINLYDVQFANNAQSDAGAIYNASGANLRVTGVNLVSDADKIVNAGTITVVDDLQLNNGKNCKVINQGVLNFDVSNTCVTLDDQYPMVDNFALVDSTQGSVAITVNSSQYPIYTGKYCLAGQAAGFTDTVTLKDNLGAVIGEFSTTNSTLTHQNFTYKLTYGSDLILEILPPDLTNQSERRTFADESTTELKFENIQVVGDFENAGAIENVSSTVIFDHCNLDSNEVNKQGGAIVNDKVINVNQSRFYSNVAQDGSAIFNRNYMEINNSLFDNNEGEKSGAVNNMGTANIWGSTFKNNYITHQFKEIGGAALYNQSQGEVSIEGSTFLNNFSALQNANMQGGAIDNWGNMDIDDTVFFRNFAGKGGALANHGSGKTQIANSTFSGNGNWKLGMGGVFYIDGGKLELSQSTVKGNSSENGGALYSQNSARTQIHSSVFAENKARNSGGALYNDGKLNVLSSTFSSNTATNLGGAVFASKNNPQESLSITDAKFNSNRANKGGAVYTEGLITLDKVEFNGNSASSGGAIYNAGGNVILGTSLFVTANDTIFNEQGKLSICNSMSWGENSGTDYMLTNGELGTLDFNLSYWNFSNDNTQPLISDWSRVQNLGSVEINLDPYYTPSKIMLVGNASEFDASAIPLYSQGVSLGILNWNNGYSLPETSKTSLGDMVYSLRVNSKDELYISADKTQSANDLNGNGTSDLILLNPEQQQLGLWLDGTNKWTLKNNAWDSSKKILGAFDLSGGNNADLVVSQIVDQKLEIGYYYNGQMSNYKSVGAIEQGVNWQMAVGKVTDNARNSIIWHAPELGCCGIWKNGTNEWQSVNGYFDKSWTLCGAGDFDGDKVDEILFEYNTNYYAFELDGTYKDLGATGSGWVYQECGDFANDGKDDIVFYHTETGTVMMFNDGLATNYASLGQLNPQDWCVQGVGDYNGDDFDDLLVRQNSTGTLGYYASGDFSKWTEIGNGADPNWMVIA